jgi:DNA-binding IclR family transcriptional regulator
MIKILHDCRKRPNKIHDEPRKLERERLRKELKACRERGIVVNLGELKKGINVFAALVLASGKRLVGALFVIGTFPPIVVERYSSMVAESAKKFFYLLGASTESV